MEQRIIYYSDELNDEFSGDHIVPIQIDGSYRYIRTGVADKIKHVFFYRMLATPLAFLYMKLHFHHKIVNKKALKQCKGKSFYIYGNHTHNLADPLIPTIVNFPKKISVIVHPNNVSMPVLGKITPYLGALPLPDDKQACKNFMDAIHRIMEKNESIMIYPEAHIWPYYTNIRPFKDTSFRYPVQYNTPVFCLTNTYHKRKFSKNPQMITYIDGPFYADTSLPAREQKKQLREQVYTAMKEKSKLNDVELIRYVKVERENDAKND